MQISSTVSQSFMQLNSSFGAKNSPKASECDCGVCDICLGKAASVSGNKKASDDEKTSTNDAEKKNKVTGEKLDAGEEQQVNKLQARDAQVRAHEAAHIAAGGSVVNGGASFTYQQGPDGKSYAVGGEVPIDVSTGKTPQETIAKMQKVRSAAMAPSDPSPQDYKVASTATILEMQARIELMQEKNEELKEKSDIYKENANATNEETKGTQEFEPLDLSA